MPTEELSSEPSGNRQFPYCESDLETTPCPLCKSDITSIIHIRRPFKVVVCGRCGLSYLNPRLKESLMKMSYERDNYFSGGDMSGYSNYISQEPSLRLTFRKFLGELKRLGLSSGSLLEVGCGYGYFLEEAKGSFSEIFGTELCPEAAAHARRLSGADIHTGDMDSMPPGWKDLDVLVAVNVIEHIYAPTEFLSAAKKRLRHKGVIVIATPDFGSFWHKILGDKWPSLKIPEHVAFYTRETLALLLETAGFGDILEISFPHAFPLGLITGKFGLDIRGRAGQMPLWIPKTMIALSAKA